MARLQLFSRLLPINKSFNPSASIYVNNRLLSSKDNSKDDDSNKELKKKEPSKKAEETINKLNLLLKQMVEDETKSKLDLARPKNQRVLKSKETSTKTTEPVEQQIVTAIKDVAESIGGNVKQTESELLMKILNPPKDESTQNISANLSDIVKGMKIDRESKGPEASSRAQQVRQVLEATRNQQRKTDNRRFQNQHQHHTGDEFMRNHERFEEINAENAESIDIFGAQPLGIFTSKFEDTQEELNSTWKKLYERDLRLAVTHPPANYFQEMILWTEQGKIWKFPIDNEQGMEDEQNIYFAEHVFLEKHLEPWCPQRGPIRHFMELVCVGLSKNPYMSVKDKNEHIEWYKNYFEDKKQLLMEIGAMPGIKQDKSKQIEAE